jgi:hypothetical protein
VEISDTVKKHKKAGVKMGGSPPAASPAAVSGLPVPTMLVKKRDGDTPKTTAYISGMPDSGRAKTQSAAAKKRKGKKIASLCALI